MSDPLWMAVVQWLVSWMWVNHCSPLPKTLRLCSFGVGVVHNIDTNPLANANIVPKSDQSRLWHLPNFCGHNFLRHFGQFERGSSVLVNRVAQKVFSEGFSCQKAALEWHTYSAVHVVRHHTKRRKYLVSNVFVANDWDFWRYIYWCWGPHSSSFEDSSPFGVSERFTELESLINVAHIQGEAQ